MPLDTMRKIIRDCSTATKTCPSIKLVERQNKSKKYLLSKVIVQKAQGSVWFSVDRKNKKWSPYLTDTNGFQKRCDYVILYNNGNQAKMIFVELKSSNVAKADVIEKFKATECFMDYCDSIAKRFFDKRVIAQCQKRFVVFHLVPSLAKTPTRSESSTHNKPDNPKFIENPNKLMLKQLL